MLFLFLPKISSVLLSSLFCSLSSAMNIHQQLPDRGYLSLSLALWVLHPSSVDSPPFPRRTLHSSFAPSLLTCVGFCFGTPSSSSSWLGTFLSLVLHFFPLRITFLSWTQQKMLELPQEWKEKSHTILVLLTKQNKITTIFVKFKKIRSFQITCPLCFS